jgi:aminoglycoside phosphotransferase (APT) family kinase protein
MQAQAAAVAELLRAIFSDTVQLDVEYMPESHSTEVYRVRRDGAVLYLRVLPEQGASFGPEAYVHRILRARGLLAPQALYFEHYNPLLQRSIMLTTEIPGRAIGYGPRSPQAQQIVRQAGRELATINSIPVHGFGWIKRDHGCVESLSAECDSYAEWLRPDLEAALATLAQRAVLSARDVQALRLAIDEAEDLFGGEPAYLAHGDFDVTHIYHQDGRYSGIIDFGEIRGANQLYDIGHFQIENADLLPDLLEGYAESGTLPQDHMRRIALNGVLIGARRLGRGVARSGAPYAPDLQAIRRMIAALQN